MKKTPVKGMADILPADMHLREHVISMIKESYARYGFMQIETPALENIENLTSKQGGDNEKLIFKVMKRGADLQRAMAKVADSEDPAPADVLTDTGLRYDLTVPLSRFYANNKESLTSPFKALQIGPVWRADQPQKGRFRQFTQCDVDILGDKSDLAEIELVAATSNMLTQIFAEVGITRFVVRINDRRILRAAALGAGFAADDVAAVLITLDKFDKIGLEGIRAELLENGFDQAVVERYLAIYEKLQEQGETGISCAEFCASLGEDVLDASVAKGLEGIIACANAMTGDDVRIAFDPTLVRGMGYYTGTIFEVSIEGYGFSIAGGGRYDEMIGKFSGQETAAVGFSIGLERILTILADHLDGGLPVSADNLAILVKEDAPTEVKMDVFKRAQELRAQGTTVCIQPMRKNMKAQIDALEKEGFTNFDRVYGD